MTPTPRAVRARAAQRERQRRLRIGADLAAPHDGVTTLAALLDAGLTRGQVQTHVEHGAWHRVGHHTVSVLGPDVDGRAAWWRALWESGSGAVLDGAVALVAAGLKGWEPRSIDVTVPNRAKVRAIAGVRHHRLRERAPTAGGALRRTRPEVAAIRAAQWAVSDTEAATILAMTVQQRLCTAAAMLARWQTVGRSNRRALLDAVVQDLCNGAHSLGELDFARLCRERGLPEPSRQVLRTGPKGSVYLDVHWEAEGVRVEIQGAHHEDGLAPVRDALRANDLAIAGVAGIALEIPVLGLRVDPEGFMRQVERALAEGRRRLRSERPGR